MGEKAKREFEINVRAINRDLDTIINHESPSKELVESSFERIRMFIDYCEKLVLEGKEI